LPGTALPVAVTAFAVLLAGTVVAANDARERHHCAGRGQTNAADFHSKVMNPARFIGLSESAARRDAERDGYLVRIACRDGKDLVGTLDLRTNRVNFGVHHGRVVGYWLA
jgi:hypothetical protein